MPEPNDFSIQPDSNVEVELNVGDTLTPKEQSDLADAALQATYRQAYLNQLRRQSCPGCGETDIIG